MKLTLIAIVESEFILVLFATPRTPGEHGLAVADSSSSNPFGQKFDTHLLHILRNDRGFGSQLA